MNDQVYEVTYSLMDQGDAYLEETAHFVSDHIRNALSEAEDSIREKFGFREVRISGIKELGAIKLGQ